MKIPYLMLCVFVTGPAVLAQAQDADAPPRGLLGQRYIQFGAGAIESRPTARLGFQGGAQVSTPVASHTDLAFRYDFSRSGNEAPMNSVDQRTKTHALGTEVTEYLASGAVQPFARVGIGYEWTHDTVRYAGAPVQIPSDNGGTWNVGTGV